MQFLRSKNTRSEELRGVLSNEHELASETDSTTDDNEGGGTDRPRLATEIELDASVRASSDSHRTLSTFAGVFCPVALSQFSTLLFMRMVISFVGHLVNLVNEILSCSWSCISFWDPKNPDVHTNTVKGMWGICKAIPAGVHVVPGLPRQLVCQPAILELLYRILQYSPLLPWA